MIPGLVVTSLVGAFLAGWMARDARARSDKEALLYLELAARPELYDYAADPDTAAS